MTARVFITGGCGFIGAKLAEKFIGDGAQVTVYDNLHPQVASIHSTNRPRLQELGVRVVIGDVCDQGALVTAVRAATPDLVYHLAAETGTGQSYDMPARYSEVNVTGTAHLIEALRAAPTRVRRVILAGSRAVYGEGACVDTENRLTPAIERTDEDLAAGDYAPKDKHGTRLSPVASNADCPANPASIYASTKLLQEYLLTQGFRGTDTEVGLLRLQNVYGPGQALDNPYTGVLSIFARQISEGKTLEIYEDGEITRDFVFIDDVVSALHRLGTIDTMPKGIIDIGSGEGATILDVARQMLKAMGKDPDRVRISGKFRPGDIRHALADISRAQNELGWRPKIDLATGLGLLIRWSSANALPRTESGGASAKRTAAASLGIDEQT